ncbi:MAG: F0F1 ATP synthase subunit B family protein [Pseudoalteromonas prydzensis]|uniref:F0F1 ATP synthase subunit B family protein n=1 Tax=Pseudoalteromonas prydzensis TaxID=182141 RepID=UPI003F9B8ACD
MLIDWFTVAAQAVNFLILVWLLKRYLYQPILHAIDAREQRIADELDAAAAKQQQASVERTIFEDKNNQFAQERDTLLQQAKAAADATRQQLLAQAQQDVAALHDKHQQIMAAEAENLTNMLRRKTSDEVFAITRKTLHDLASASLEQQVTEVFIAQLSELQPAAKTMLVNALKTSKKPALLTSAFELPDTERAAIDKAIKATFGADIDLEFATSAELISGIELSTNSQKLGWNIADYLQSLEQDVVALLKQNGKAVEQGPADNKTKRSSDNKPNDELPDQGQDKGKVRTSQPITNIENHHE